MLAFVLKQIKIFAFQKDYWTGFAGLLKKVQLRSRIIQEEELEAKKAAILQNLQRLTSARLIHALQHDYEEIESEIRNSIRLTASTIAAPKPTSSVDEKVEAAMQKMHWLRQIIQDPTARSRLPIYERTRLQPKLMLRDQLFGVDLSQLWSAWRSALIIVESATVCRWHRAGFRLCRQWKSRDGRPRIERELRELIPRDRESVVAVPCLRGLNHRCSRAT